MSDNKKPIFIVFDEIKATLNEIQEMVKETGQIRTDLKEIKEILDKKEKEKKELESLNKSGWFY